jgi:hypothetical protein
MEMLPPAEPCPALVMPPNTVAVVPLALMLDNVLLGVVVTVAPPPLPPEAPPDPPLEPPVDPLLPGAVPSPLFAPFGLVLLFVMLPLPV